MSQLVGYNLYWKTLVAKSTFSATVASSSVRMQGLPFGIDPKLCVLFLLIMSGETGSTTTLDAQIQVSHDNVLWFDLGAAETQLTAADTDGIHYIPDIGGAHYYRINNVFGGATSFDDFEQYAIVATQGYRVSA